MGKLATIEIPADAASASDSMTREEWLRALALKIVPVIEAVTGEAFPQFRVSCSWPARGGLKKVGTVLGQCWQPVASSDQHWEIFISPLVDDPREVTRILAHELCHAAAPNAGHKKRFQVVAGGIGLCAPWTSTPTTEAFWAWAEPLLGEMPAYGHGHMTPFVTRIYTGTGERGKDQPQPRAEGAPKPQTNRQMKCTCKSCGYIARTSRKWLDEAGPPHCPNHGAMEVAQ